MTFPWFQMDAPNTDLSVTLNNSRFFKTQILVFCQNDLWGMATEMNIDDASLPRSGSASDRVKQIFNQSEFEAPPRSG